MRRTAYLLALLALALTQPGCIRALFDPGPPPRDAGVDAWMDVPDHWLPDGGDAGDADLDAGPDAQIDAPICERQELTCRGGMDEDCDGLVDCDDDDCGAVRECCGDPQPLFPEDWASAAEWNEVPVGGSSVRTDAAMRRVITWSSGTTVPHGLVRSECVPVELGVRFTGTLIARRTPPDCGGEAPCEPYAAIALVSAPSMAPDGSYELAVRLDAAGNATVVYRGRRLATGLVNGTGSPVSSVGFGISTVTYDITLTPGTEDGVAMMFADITLTGASSMFRIERLPAIFREDLLSSTAGCRDARGLFLRVEGLDDDVDLGQLGAERLSCANPAYFDAADGRGVALEVPEPAAWAAGGVGQPTLTCFRSAPGDTPQWELAYDASTTLRTNEPYGRTAFSIGGLRLSDLDGLGMWSARRAGGVLLGAEPPTTCTAMCSVREPYLWAPVDGSGVRTEAAMRILWAQESGSTSEWPPFEIHHGLLDAVSGAARVGESGVLLAPGDGLRATTGCTSLREPVLLPRSSDGADGFYVLFRCEHGVDPWEFRVAQADASLVPSDVSGAVVAIPATPRYASGGVVDVGAGTWFQEDGTVLYRLWYLTRAGSSSAPAVSFAQAVATSEDLAMGRFPTLRPYDANPVLLSNDPVLGTCLGTCRTEAIAVARSVGEPAVVRLLIARRQVVGDMITRTMLPLDQLWGE